MLDDKPCSLCLSTFVKHTDVRRSIFKMTESIRVLTYVLQFVFQMNFETISNDNDNLDAVVPSAVAVAINNIYNGHDAVMNSICSNVIVIPTDINLSVRIPEVVDNKFIDWDRVVDVHSVVHTNIDNTSI